MYSIYLCAAIGIVIGFGVASRTTGAKLGGIVGGGVIGAVVGLIVGLFVSIATPRHEVTYGPSTMVSMRTTDGVTGTFVFGTGGIRGETTYNFMIKLQDGSVTPRSVPANSLVAIIEDESLAGVGYWRTTYRESDPGSILYKWGIGHSDSDRVVRQEFRVPVGTVVQTFKVQ
ncbi:MAG: hypothetical protein IT342_18440 [Candidatus Melainabacteria bacterium]|nr:hypothetical protein [Candidatus Melainabacteria bacterium]